jgi:hypothetical protein
MNGKARRRSGLPTDSAARVADGADRWPDTGRLWAAVMLASSPEVCGSILQGKPVMARLLDREALRRALRGDPPPPRDFILITPEHLAALDECGPLLPERGVA